MTGRLGPTVVAGLAGSGLATLAAGRSWVTGAGTGPDAGGWASATALTTNLPLAQALGLVLLACWGVLLVLRGRPRRAVAWLGLLAAAGTVAAVVAGAWLVPDQVRRTLAEEGIARDAEVGLGGWYWLALVGALVALGTALVAVRSVAGWPEMGARYDAPGGDRAAARREEPSRTDLWRALDEGEDPTAGGRP